MVIFNLVAIMRNSNDHWKINEWLFEHRMWISTLDIWIKQIWLVVCYVVTSRSKWKNKINNICAMIFALCKSKNDILKKKWKQRGLLTSDFLSKQKWIGSNPPTCCKTNPAGRPRCISADMTEYRGLKDPFWEAKKTYTLW